MTNEALSQAEMREMKIYFTAAGLRRIYDEFGVHGIAEVMASTQISARELDIAAKWATNDHNESGEFTSGSCSGHN